MYKVKTIILVKAMVDFLLYHGFESQQLLLNNCGGGSSAVAYLINFLDLAG